jgi:multicomponent Na+:H+ antiporter subunit E
MKMKQREQSAESRFRRPSFVVVQFIILFAFWLLLSGHYDIKHVVMGVVAALIVTLLTCDLFYSIFFLRGISDSSEKGGLLFVILCFVRILAYIPWLLYQIIIANLRVAYLVLNPRMPINPHFLFFGTGLRRSISLVTLANSITLTPGTVTVDLKEGSLLVHVLEPRVAQKPLLGRVQNKVGAIFGEREEPPPNFLWAHAIPSPGWDKITKQDFSDNFDK